MNKDKVLLLLAAQGDPKKAAEIESYLHEDKAAPDEAQQRDSESVRRFLEPDGLYLVFTDGTHVAYEPGKVTEAVKQACTGLAVKMGDKALTLGLFNLQNGDDLTLTCEDSPKDYDPAAYKDTYEDAGADWDGKANTERMLAAGILNENISDCLLPGQYVPAMGEMLFIHLFRKQINQALRELDGQEISGWYWTSTEYSATSAWYLYLYYGYMNAYAKAANANRVRPVSAFIPAFNL